MKISKGMMFVLLSDQIVTLTICIPSPGKMGPKVIDKGQPIEPIGQGFVTIRELLFLVFAHGPTLVGPYQGKG